MSISYCFVTEKEFDWENNNKMAIAQKWQKLTKTSYCSKRILSIFASFEQLPFYYCFPSQIFFSVTKQI